MTFQKEINKDVSNAGNFNSGFTGSESADLARFSKTLQTTIDSSLNVASKGLSKDYRAVNKSYGETLGNLLPEINKGIAKNGKVEDYYAIGRIITNNTNPSKIKKLMNSIDSSFKIAKKEGITLKGAVKSADEAKQMIRQTYLKNIFGETSADFKPEEFYKRLYKVDKSPQEAERLKALLGKDGYNTFKKTSNALLESNKKPGSDMFSLAVRSREISAATGLVGGIEAAKGAVGTGLGIVGVPWALSKIFVTPKAANKLLYLNSEIKRYSLGNTNITISQGEALSADYIGKAVASIINELPEHDKEEIKNHMGTKEEW